MSSAFACYRSLCDPEVVPLAITLARATSAPVCADRCLILKCFRIRQGPAQAVHEDALTRAKSPQQRETHDSKDENDDDK